MTPAALLEAAHGVGWGNVLKQNGIHPGVGQGVGNLPEKPGPPEEAGRPENAGPDKDGPPGQIRKNNAGGESGANLSELVGQGGHKGNGGGNNNNNGNHHDNGNGNGNNGHGNGGHNGSSNGRGNKK
jgi:hypothetical protein